MTDAPTIRRRPNRRTGAAALNDTHIKLTALFLFFHSLTLRLNVRGGYGATAFMCWDYGNAIDKLTTRTRQQQMTSTNLQNTKASIFGRRINDSYLSMQLRHNKSNLNGQTKNQNSTTTLPVVQQPQGSDAPTRKQKSLVSSTTQHGSSIPNHIAFVCDGNARWARQRRLPVAAGHAAGADRLTKIIDDLGSINGIDYATFYAFSMENWKRSAAEIQYLFAVMERTAHTMFMKNQGVTKKRPIRIRFLGDLDDSRIPDSVRIALRKLEDQSQPYDSTGQTATGKQCPLTVSIAINYSARNDIVQAVQKIAVANEIPLNCITQDDIRSHLSTRHIPDPDLIVRTSGENRLSNWLLWEAAYAEFYVSNVHWPDFDRSALEEAIISFGKRQRRFGGREQLDDNNVN